MTDKIALVVGCKIPEEQKESISKKNIQIYEQVAYPHAIQIAQALEKEQKADVIISPTGTAMAIRKHVHIPIIGIASTYFNLLQTLLCAEQETGFRERRIALILHESRAIDVSLLEQFLHNRVFLFSYRCLEDIPQLVHKLSFQDFAFICGGSTVCSCAVREGISAYETILSEETFSMALDQAREVLNYLSESRRQHQLLRTALDLTGDGVLITDASGNITDCNITARSLFEENGIANPIQKNFDQIFPHIKEYRHISADRPIERFIELSKEKYFISRRPILADGKPTGSVTIFQNVSRIEKLEHQYRKLQTKGLVAQHTFSDIIGTSPAFETVIQHAKAYAQVDSTILISGETGTGKEIFAQSIHNASKVQKGPFVAINCAALPPNLLESELMGYEEGAFTGAKRGGKAGLFELAHGGTIFLDEIDQLPIELQGRLLRIIQEKQVLRLGGEKIIPVHTRIITATNADLPALIRSGRFREDLYYRIQVLSLALPPLRDHPQDIPLLLRFCFDRFARSFVSPSPFSEEGIRLLQGYRWPGNVRELNNFVERYVVIQSQLHCDELTFILQYISGKKEPVSRGEALCGSPSLTIPISTFREMEDEILRQMLARFHGNRSQAAAVLGIGRSTMWKRIPKSAVEAAQP